MATSSAWRPRVGPFGRDLVMQYCNMQHDIVHNPEPGRPLHLIRWRMDRDGWWCHDVIRGQYVRHDPDVWIVDVGGHEQRLPRSTWIRYLAESPPHPQKSPPT